MVVDIFLAGSQYAMDTMATDLVLINEVSSSTNAWGDREAVESSTLIKGVVYNQNKVRNWDSYGIETDLVMNVFIPNNNVVKRDHIIYNGIKFRVFSIRPAEVSGTNVGSILTVYSVM